MSILEIPHRIHLTPARVYVEWASLEQRHRKSRRPPSAPEEIILWLLHRAGRPGSQILARRHVTRSRTTGALSPVCISVRIVLTKNHAR
jgi:hypothetical protein